MKRVVMFTPGLTEGGGAARRSNLLATELANRDWDVRVLTRAGTLRAFQVTRRPGLVVVDIPGFGSRRLGAVLFLIVAVPLGLMWGLKAHAFLSIQITTQTTAAAVTGALLRKPYIALLTTGGTVSELSYVLSSRLHRPRRWLLGRARSLVAQTDHAAQELRAAFPATKVVVTPNPVIEQMSKSLDGRPRALFTGRLSEEKDLLRLLEVWTRVAAEDESARLTLVGSGGAYRSIEDAIRSKVSEEDILRASVHITGWVDDVKPYLADHDVFVFPSLSEGMSNSLLEACAAGLVVVVSDIPSNLAVVGDDYLLAFQSGDGESLQTALRSALYDDYARSTALSSIAERMHLFSLDLFIDRIERLIA